MLLTAENEPASFCRDKTYVKTFIMTSRKGNNIDGGSRQCHKINVLWLIYRPAMHCTIWMTVQLNCSKHCTKFDAHPFQKLTKTNH